MSFEKSVCDKKKTARKHKHFDCTATRDEDTFVPAFVRRSNPKKCVPTKIEVNCEKRKGTPESKEPEPQLFLDLIFRIWCKRSSSTVSTPVDYRKSTDPNKCNKKTATDRVRYVLSIYSPNKTRTERCSGTCNHEIGLAILP